MSGLGLPLLIHCYGGYKRSFVLLLEVTELLWAYLRWSTLTGWLHPEAIMTLGTPGKRAGQYQKDCFLHYYLLLLLRTGSPQLTFCSRRKTSGIQKRTTKCLIRTLILHVPSQSCHPLMTHALTLLGYGHLQWKPSCHLGSSIMIYHMATFRAVCKCL